MWKKNRKTENGSHSGKDAKVRAEDEERESVANL
jgi:hypothetical protein